MMDKLKWYLRQLIPHICYTTYTKNSIKYFCIWKMWMGRSYNITRFKIGEKIGG